MCVCVCVRARARVRLFASVCVHVRVILFSVLFIALQIIASLLLFLPGYFRLAAIYSLAPLSPRTAVGRRAAQVLEQQQDYRDGAGVALRAHQPRSAVRRPAAAHAPVVC